MIQFSNTTASWKIANKNFHEAFPQFWERAMEFEERISDFARRACSSMVINNSDFVLMPASKTKKQPDGSHLPGKHHCRIGGLLEHTIEVYDFAMAAARVFDLPQDKRRILEVAAIYHDVGKLDEYDLIINSSRTDYEFTCERTDIGKLVPHLPLSALRVQSAQPYFAEPDWAELLHCVLAHHGRHEWGSPVTPQTITATILHQSDVLSVMKDGGLNPDNRP